MRPPSRSWLVSLRNRLICLSPLFRVLQHRLNPLASQALACHRGGLIVVVGGRSHDVVDEIGRQLGPNLGVWIGDHFATSGSRPLPDENGCESADWELEQGDREGFCRGSAVRQVSPRVGRRRHHRRPTTRACRVAPATGQFVEPGEAVALGVAQLCLLPRDALALTAYRRCSGCRQTLSVRR